MVTQTEALIQPPEFKPPLFGIAALVSAILIFGVWLLINFVSDIYSHDKQNWREKLNLIAESREAEVVHWVDGHFAELRSLAENPSLQLYLSELQAMPAEAANQDESQKSYLRNLLIFTADRGGFSNSSSYQKSISANIKTESTGALAILNQKNEIVVSTSISDTLKDELLQNVSKMPFGKELFVDIFKGEDGKLYSGFVLPIYGIQGNHTASGQMGRVVGLINIDERLFGLLKHPGVTEKTLEAILLRKSGSEIEYISPLQDGSGARSKKMDETDDLTESSLLTTTGSFSSGKNDYRDVDVLATSRPIARTPWTLVVKIDRQEALADSDSRRNSLIFTFILVILIVILTVLAVWWQAYSRRSLMQSRYFQKLSTHALAQEKMLRLVADNQPEAIYIVDQTSRIHFSNQKAAYNIEMTPESMLDKTLTDLHGAGRAKAIADLCSVALEEEQVVFDVKKIGERIIRFAFIPIQHIPVSSLLKFTPGVLVVEQDITEAVSERERRLATLRQLVRTLVRLVDQRDPFAANHSLMVSELSYQIALGLGLDAILAETVRIAAKLMNIGKIVVPVELLTKTKALTDDEKKNIAASISSAAKYINHIEFEGPVCKTLEQCQERWDGSGPLGLKGDDIILTARIIGSANAFIGMVSPRSWRDAMTIESATQFILGQAGAQFDRSVIVAMVNYIENHNGGSWIRKSLESAKTGQSIYEGNDSLI